MAGPATLKIEIIADAARAVVGMRRVGDAATDAGKKTEAAGSKFGSLAANAAKLGGAAALGGVVAVFKTGIDEQKDFLAGQAQLANGIKSTGNAAGVSVAGLEDLASSVQNYSGQTDDSIVASEKLLLTFTGVRNAAGKNNDVFNQATKVTADMAAKMGGDASTYAVQLGKALNDPVAGISKLTKIGVTFDAGQKKQITSMAKAHNTIGAQKVILAELNKEFGGSAKAAGSTLPGQMARAKRSFEDVSQSVVASFMPALTGMANILTTTVVPAFAALMNFFISHKGAAIAFGVAIAGVYLAMKAGQASSAVAGAGGLAKWIAQTNIAKGATAAWAAVQWVMNAALDAFPIIAIVLGVLALIAILVLAYNKVGWFHDAVNAMGRGAKAAFELVKNAALAVFNWVKTNWPLLLAILTGPLGVAIFLIIKNWNTIKAVFVAGVAVIRGVFGSVVSFFAGLPGQIGGAIATVFHAIISPFQAAWNWISSSVIGPLRNAFSGLVGAIGDALGGVFDAVISPFRSAWNWIDSHVIGPLKSAWNTVANALNGAHFTYTVPSNVVTKALRVAGKGFTLGLPHLPTFHSGGYVPHDMIASLQGGETVIPRSGNLNGAGVNGATVNLTVNVNVPPSTDPAEVGRQVTRTLKAYVRANGSDSFARSLGLVAS